MTAVRPRAFGTPATPPRPNRGARGAIRYNDASFDFAVKAPPLIGPNGEMLEVTLPTLTPPPTTKEPNIMNVQPADVDVQIAAPQPRHLPPRNPNDSVAAQQTEVNRAAAQQNTEQQEQRLEIDPAELPALAQLLIQQKEASSLAHTRQISAMELQMTAMQARIIRYEGLLRERDATIADLESSLNSYRMERAAAQKPVEANEAPTHDGGEYASEKP